MCEKYRFCCFNRNISSFVFFLLDCCRHPWWCLTFQTCSQEGDAWGLLCFQSPSWHHTYRSKKKVSALNSKPTLVLLLVFLKEIPVDVLAVTLMGLEHWEQRKKMRINQGEGCNMATFLPEQGKTIYSRKL